jgi:hypothetical protein
VLLITTPDLSLRPLLYRPADIPKRHQIDGAGQTWPNGVDHVPLIKRRGIMASNLCQTVSVSFIAEIYCALVAIGIKSAVLS